MENINEYLIIAAAVYSIASVIARITPTKRDDEVMTTIGRVFNKTIKILEKILLSSNTTDK